MDYDRQSQRGLAEYLLHGPPGGRHADVGDAESCGRHLDALLDRRSEACFPVGCSQVSGNFRWQIRVMEFSHAALHHPSIQAVTAGALVSAALFYNWAKISGSGRTMTPPVVRRMRSADSNHPWRLETKARRTLGSMTQMLTTPNAR